MVLRQQQRRDGNRANYPQPDNVYVRNTSSHRRIVPHRLLLCVRWTAPLLLHPNQPPRRA
jgi:hypothetical protein